MENTISTPHSRLLDEIVLLKQKKLAEEDLLKVSLKEFALSLKPLSIIKDSIHELVSDKVVKEDIVTAGIKFGTNFVIEKIMGRNRNLKGFLGSVLVEQLAATLISKKVSPLVAEIFKEKEDDEMSLSEYSN